MSDRGARRGAGAPFYAPPRRKTSAEIISEARAAIYGEMSSASSGVGGGVVRPLRTRRPFTPREPQRTLFSDRARKRDQRPPSAFDLKYLSLSESNEELTAAILGAQVAKLDEETLNGILVTEPQTNSNARKKPTIRNPTRLVQDRSSDVWGGFTKLPHLSGKSKPLHRRNTIGQTDEPKTDQELAQAISVTRPLGSADGDNPFAGYEDYNSKSLSPDTGSKRRQFAGSKSQSYDFGTNHALGDIPVKQLAVQLPNTSVGDFDSLTVLELAEALSERTRDVDHILQLMEALQNNVQKNIPANSLRDMVLRSLYTHIDSDDERVLVAIARAMLTMRVTGTHLAAACKLVFKIARNDKNDHFFRNTNLLELVVEGCARADPVSEGECCVYGAGALRFLALEPRLCTLAHRAGALHLAALHLKILNAAKAENPRAVAEQSTHALYQLTGALRNLAGAGEEEVRTFVSSGALGELLAALQHHTDRDVLTNVARCLSVLSAEESCCAWLCAADAGARALLTALAACAARAPLAVRLAYTLGNMAAADHQARLNIYNEEGGVDVLLTILESYTKRNEHETRDAVTDPDLHLVGTDLGGSDGSNEDVLIKTVRVVANLCLTEKAGRGLAATYAERTIKALLACLELAEKTTSDVLPDLDHDREERPSWSERREELATAAFATLNNITFYREPPEPLDPLDEILDKLCKVTCRWLDGSGPAACEAVRALGNLSRSTRAAKLIVLEGALQGLGPFLQHEDAEVRCAAAGVLVNVCGAGGACAPAAGVAARALCVAAAARDAPAAALLARALWNAHAHAPLSHAHAQHASAALAAFIDDESVFAACEASHIGERRASDPALSKHHVKFDVDNNNYEDNFYEMPQKPPFIKAYSVEPEVNLDSDEDGGRTICSGEDLGFEEGDLVEEEECDCGPCRRLAAWEELVGVAIPLLEKLRPPRADASVGTD
ncbi:armadillo repeat-containing protein 2 [Galleria mellonella]|uniref:Armadillo repeat-containing protein 2 n=1 Tax=Galleria mellonella TaxID=7137 RepID=A0ABM3MKX3_GALME|nr:armadillo repeat-containing protein 2 [Galleria mellonella]XP_052752030.1 armadillo repeat-containing protein 2 [Galleria mellonella]